jgi:acyl-coenzyme A thioesterase PaaI-like protein
VLAAVGASACVSTQVSGREITRLAPLREAPIRPASAEGGKLVLDAGTDALDDEELQAMQAELAAHLADEVAGAASWSAGPARGAVRVQRCMLRVGLGRRYSTYVARCRVAHTIDGTVVVEAEAEAVRRAGAKAVTKARGAEIRALVARGGRNPLVSYDDSRQALRSALSGALRVLVTGEALRAEDEPAPTPVDGALMRRDALRRLERSRGEALAAAAVDLGRWGSPDDGAHLLPLLDDGEPLVRLAAATSIGELGTKRAWSALNARRDDTDPRVSRAVELALARLRALYPELSDAPSNSSTAGGGD